MRTKVENIEVIDLRVKITTPSLQKYLPQRLFPEKISFEVYPVSNAVSNAIRRTASSELLVRRMTCTCENISSTDVFLIPDMIVSRLKMVPMDQLCPIDTTFELVAANNTAMIRDIKTSEIRITGGKKPPKTLPFNGTFTLFTLQPGTSVKISNIHMLSAFGFMPGDCMCCIAINAASTALDQIPINMYLPADAPRGIPSRISNPRKWKISFNTNGELPAREIVKESCDNLIKRIQSINDLLYSIEHNDDEYVLVIPGETDTIGNLLMRTIVDLYPDIRAVIYVCAHIGRSVHIRIRCDEDVSTIFTTTIDHLVKIFTDIKGYFG